MMNGSEQNGTAIIRQKRAAWITPVLGVDGRLLYFGPLLLQLSDNFHDFAVYTAEYSGNIKDAGFTIIQCGAFRRLYNNERHTEQHTDSYSPGISLATPTIFLQILKDKPDLLIINEFSLFSLYAALSRIIRPSLRILWIVEARPRVSGGKIINVSRTLFRRFLTLFADIFLTNNTDGRDYLVTNLDISPDKIIAKPYLVSNPGNGEQHIHAIKSLEEPVRFIFVGQLLKRKGIQNAIEACRIISETHRGQFIFQVIGDGPYKPQLLELSSKYGLDDTISFLGKQPYDQLAKYYRDAHVFLFPTLCDYRALTPFEALSQGLPIIASTHDGGCAETVNPGKNGFPIDPDDVSSIADAMLFFLSNRERISEFSAESNRMASGYTLEKAIATLSNAAIRALNA